MKSYHHSDLRAIFSLPQTHKSKIGPPKRTDPKKRVMPVFFSINFRRKLKKDRYLFTRLSKLVIDSLRGNLKYGIEVDTQLRLVRKPALPEGRLTNYLGTQPNLTLMTFGSCEANGQWDLEDFKSEFGNFPRA